MHGTPWHWTLGALAAVLTGISKTGVPGAGILVVPMMAVLFGGRVSVGTLLPLLIMGDVFAATWYRHDVDWSQLRRLAPWVAAGIAIGASALWELGRLQTHRDPLGPVIGGLTLAMLGIHLLRVRKSGPPHMSHGFVGGAGVLAGAATTIANAAGPVMSVYLAGQRLPKSRFMGITAWFFFVLNLSKVPIYAALTAVNPAKPMMTVATLRFDAMMAPAVVAGVLLGKWLLPRMKDSTFTTLVLVLAAAASVKLLAG